MCIRMLMLMFKSLNISMGEGCRMCESCRSRVIENTWLKWLKIAWNLENRGLSAAKPKGIGKMPQFIQFA